MFIILNISSNVSFFKLSNFRTCKVVSVNISMFVNFSTKRFSLFI